MMKQTLLLILVFITVLCILVACSAPSTTDNKTVTANITTTASTPKTSTAKPVATKPATTTPAVPSNLPVIQFFDAAPAIIREGGLSTLSWYVSNATSVSISPTAGAVSQSASLNVSPVTSTKYTLTAANQHGSITAAATVMVEKPHSTLLPVVLNYSISPRILSENNSVEISWHVYGADVVQLSLGTGKTATIISQRLTPTGKMSIVPTWVAPKVSSKVVTTIPTSISTYTLTAKSITGETIASVDVTLLTNAILPKPGIPIAQDNVTVIAATALPLIKWLAADPVTIVQGNSTTLTWEVIQATSVLLNGIEVDTTGSKVVSPTATTTYTLTASNEYWTTTKAVTVTVLAYKPEWFKPLVQ